MLEGCAALAAGRQPARALGLAGAAAALREIEGGVLTSAEANRLDRFLAPARRAVGRNEAMAAWATGRSTPLEQTIADAETLLAEPPTATVLHATSEPVGLAGLTSRELAVLRLIAEGRSNREIADTLFVSRRTVTTHTTGIFTKLGVGSRTAAIAAARRLGLV